MNYPRFFVPEKKVIDGKFSIENPQDVKKIIQVLRLGQGDQIVLLDNSSREYIAEIEEITKKQIRGSILETITTSVSDTSKLGITFAQALPKGSKMDSIIRMNTELGVKAFIPFESEHSVVKLNKFNPKKLERWRKIAKSASEQSERNSIPEIFEPIKFDELLKVGSSGSDNFDHKLLFHSRQTPNSQNIVQIKSAIENVTATKKNVLISVGPEGGFSDTEVNLAIEADWKIVWIDLPILRTETAGVVICGYLLIY